MKLLILSDSHGHVEPMVRAVEQTQPDWIFHLGDCFPDGQALHRKFPRIPFVQVPGNCDLRPDEPAEKLLELEGQRILLCHGHTYGVKSSLLSAGYAAQEKEADLFLFGHTHRPFCDLRGKCWLVNPGSIGDIRRPAYALITLSSAGISPTLLELS